MNKKLLSVLFFLSGTCAASSQVDLYGIIDTGMAYSRVNGQTRIYQETGFAFPSRFGIRGKEDLGGGISFGFVLEQGFESNNGASSQGAKYAFGRESNFSIYGPWGRFGMGRLGNFMSGMGSWCSWGPNASPFATGWGLASSGSTFADYLRMNNTVAWQSPVIKGWQAMAQYSLDVLGNDEEVFSNNTRYFSAGVKYQGERAHSELLLGWRMNPQIAGKGYKDTLVIGYLVNYQFEKIKPFLSLQYSENALSVGKGPLMVFKASGAEKEKQKGLTGYSSLIGANLKLGSGTFKAAAQSYFGKNKTESGSCLRRYVLSLGYEHPLSKRTAIYGGLNYGRSSQKTSSEKIVYRAEEAYAGIYHRF